LATKLHKPICLAIASQDEDNNPYLEICIPIYVSEDSITETVQLIYNKFESTLNQNIGGWRFWFRHHLQAVETLSSSNMLNPSVDFFNKDHNLGVDINSGLIYEIERG